jgi:hypothetical protein
METPKISGLEWGIIAADGLWDVYVYLANLRIAQNALDERKMPTTLELEELWDRFRGRLNLWLDKSPAGNLPPIPEHLVSEVRRVFLLYDEPCPDRKYFSRKRLSKTLIKAALADAAAVAS